MRLLAMQWLKPTTSAGYKGAYFAFAAFWADGEGQYDLRLDKGTTNPKGHLVGAGQRGDEVSTLNRYFPSSFAFG